MQGIETTLTITLTQTVAILEIDQTAISDRNPPRTKTETKEITQILIAQVQAKIHQTKDIEAKAGTALVQNLAERSKILKRI